jgi:hypothetical protein
MLMRVVSLKTDFYMDCTIILSVWAKQFVLPSQKEIYRMYNFMIFAATKNGRTKKMSPFLFGAVIGSGIRDPGSGIRDGRKSGSVNRISVTILN